MEVPSRFRSPEALEATVPVNDDRSPASEAAEARGPLQTAWRHLTLGTQREFADKFRSMTGYETQMRNLRESIANVDTQLRQLIDRDDAQLTMALRNFKLDLEQPRQLNNCFNLLNAHCHVTATIPKLKNESRRLKQKASELESRMSSELRQYENRAAERIERMKEIHRQVTNELLTTLESKKRGTEIPKNPRFPPDKDRSSEIARSSLSRISESKPPLMRVSPLRAGR